MGCNNEKTIDEKNIDDKNIDDKNIDEKKNDDKNIDEKNIDDKNIDDKNIDTEKAQKKKDNKKHNFLNFSEEYKEKKVCLKCGEVYKKFISAWQIMRTSGIPYVKKEYIVCIYQTGMFFFSTRTN